MFYIYIIYSVSSDKYYVGHSDKPSRRLIEHNTKPFNTYTSKRRPWVLKISFPVSESRGQAMKVERYIKKRKSRTFLEQIISAKNNPDLLAQLVRVPPERD